MAIVKENIILNGLIKSGLIKDSLINQSEDSVVTEAPNITGIFDILDGEYLEEYTLNLNVLNTGGKAASWEWAGIGVPPSWATLNNNGVITGIAAVGTWSDYSVKAINAIGSSISNVDSVTISAPGIPELTGTFDLIDGTVGSQYTFDCNTLNTGGTVESWAISGTYPEWVSLDVNTGIITGVAAEGSWSGYAVIATNITGVSPSNTDSIDIFASIVFSGIFDMVDVTVGDSYNYDVSSLFSSGGVVTSYEFTGTPPTGASISSSGLITGTAEEGAWAGYSVKATNLAGSVFSNTDSIEVSVVLAPPIASGIFNPQDGELGVAYSYATAFIFTGGAVASYSISGTLPDGLTIDSGTGVISGTPTVSNDFTSIAVTGTNTDGSDTSNIADINIPAILTPPIASGIFNPPDIAEGGAYSYATAFIFTGGAVTSYSINGTLPDGLTIDSGTGLISGTATTAGISSGLSITGTNADGSDTSNIADIEVTAVVSVITFMAAKEALTDVQNVDAEGNIMNLMPKGTITATSTHSTPVLAPDKDSVYREYPVDGPVWKGGNVALDPAKLWWEGQVSALTPASLATANLQFNDGSTHRETYTETDNSYLIGDTLASGANATYRPGDGATISVYAGEVANMTAALFSSNKLTGNVPDFNNSPNLTLAHFHKNQLTGNVPDFSNNPSLIQARFYSNQLTGNAPDFSNNPNLTVALFDSNQLTGNAPDFSNNPNLTDARFYTNQLTGNVPDFSNNTKLNNAKFQSNQLTGFLGGWPATAFSLDLSNNALTEAAVNLILTEADTYGIATGTTINLTGGSNAAPTGAGITAKTNLIANGAVVSTN